VLQHLSLRIPDASPECNTDKHNDVAVDDPEAPLQGGATAAESITEQNSKLHRHEEFTIT
jgi:hypothetical protein